MSRARSSIASRATPWHAWGALCLAGLPAIASAQAVMGPSPRSPEARAPEAAKTAEPERTVGEWLRRMHDASRSRNYSGTFVVLTYMGNMSSARIWHACEGPQQVERVDTLTGVPRSTFRRNDDVVTFMPEKRTVRTEKRESLGLFPDLLKTSEAGIAEFYIARKIGTDRVAGFDTDVVQVTPKDPYRFGYRIWSERKTGLAVKLQTVDRDGNVLEQAAFSELVLDAPVRFDKLTQMMNAPDGWRVEKSEASKTTAAAEGWATKPLVPGFKPVSCYQRPAEGVLQCIFSDGLAALSLFVEDYDGKRHFHESLAANGATHTLTKRVQEWWVTVVGEVPPQTLKSFSLSLERRK